VADVRSTPAGQVRQAVAYAARLCCQRPPNARCESRFLAVRSWKRAEEWLENWRPAFSVRNQSSAAVSARRGNALNGNVGTALVKPACVRQQE